MFFYLFLTMVLVLLDQFTKFLTIENMGLYEVKSIIPKVLSFTYIQNTGAAWSILEGKMLFFYLISVIVIAFLLYYLWTEGKTDRVLGVILSVVLAGTIGNFIDRLRYQYVIDMIKLEFVNFPIFNVADMLLTVGVFALLFYSVYEETLTK